MLNSKLQPDINDTQIFVINICLERCKGFFAVVATHTQVNGIRELNHTTSKVPEGFRPASFNSVKYNFVALCLKNSNVLYQKFEDSQTFFQHYAFHISRRFTGWPALP